jgi:hypothetical protein
MSQEEMMPVSHQTKKVIRVGPGGDPVAAGIRKARKAWDEYQANVEFSRDAVYGYLKVVFDLVQQWDKKKLADEYSLKALKQDEWGNGIRMKADPYARVIYCSSKAEPKIRSKWAIIMQWVADNNRRGRSFTEFVTNIGGLNECVKLAAAARHLEWT